MLTLFVTDNGVHKRDRPGLQGIIIDTLMRGTEIDPDWQTPIIIIDNWHWIRLHDGGYMAAEFLSLIDPLKK